MMKLSELLNRTMTVEDLLDFAEAVMSCLDDRIFCLSSELTAEDLPELTYEVITEIMAEKLFGNNSERCIEAVNDILQARKATEAAQSQAMLDSSDPGSTKEKESLNNEATI